MGKGGGEGNVHAPKRGDIKILRSTADARQTTDRDTARELEREREVERARVRARESHMR